jgi:ribonuclease-3
VEQSALEKCQELIEYHFTNPALLELALTHSSVAPTRVLSNERLEFLGDAVLGLVVCHQLYIDCQKAMEGEMTKIKSAVVSRQTCATIADEIGLSDLMSMGKGMARPSGLPQSISAAVFESIIGAVYLDGGLEAARTFILRHMRQHIEEALGNEHQRNYKSLLQQYAQRHMGATPVYQLLDEKGPDHSKCFEIGVSVRGRVFPSGWGKNKKEAEQEAAHRALTELGVLGGESGDDGGDVGDTAE